MSQISIPILLNIFWECRDMWCSTETIDNNSCKKSSFSEFTNYILTFVNNHNTEPPQCVVNLFNILLDNHSYLLYSDYQIVAKLRKQPYSRMYRIASGADCRHCYSDSRPREFLQHLITSKFPFHWKGIFLTTFYNCDRTITRSNTFKRTSCSRLEQLINISICCLISEGINEASKTRRNPDSLNSSVIDFFLANSTRKQNVGPYERVEWAIQKIFQAWTEFASSAGFNSLESMVLPYIYIDDTKYIFKSIETRSLGFNYSKMKSTLVFGLKTTSKREEAMQQSFDFPENVDTIMRRVTNLFLKDIYNIIKYRELYTIPDGAAWMPIQKYRSFENRLPSRFDAFSVSDIRIVKRRLRNERRNRRKSRR